MTAAALDTSFIVRYLTNDPPEMAEAAARVIDGLVVLAISPVALVESAYVLSKGYGVPRQQVVEALVGLVQKENVTILDLDKPITIEALLLCGHSARVSFADAVVWAHVRSAGISTIYSFDKRFPSEGIKLISGDQAE